MPNPYHDEAGRFTSRDEMRGAIERLRDEGKLKEALALSLELSDIDYARASEPKSLLFIDEYSNADGFFEAGSMVETYKHATADKLESDWRAGNIKETLAIANLLNAPALTDKLRDEVISTLDFGDRYSLLESYEFGPSVAKALIDGQEEGKLGNLSHNDLLYVGMYSLGRDEAAKYATRSPSLAYQFLREHEYLQDNPEFDRQVIAFGHKSGGVTPWEHVAEKTEDRAVLIELIDTPGINYSTLEYATRNTILGNAGAAAVIDRAASFLGDWDSIRENLADNTSVSNALRERLEHAALIPTVPYRPNASEESVVNEDLAMASETFEFAKEDTRRLTLSGNLDDSELYYAAVEAQRDAFGTRNFYQAQQDAIETNLSKLDAKTKSPRNDPNEQALLEQRLSRAAAFLQWRSIKRVFNDLVQR